MNISLVVSPGTALVYSVHSWNWNGCDSINSNTISKITAELSWDLCKCLWTAKPNEWLQMPRPVANRINAKGKVNSIPQATVAFLVENSVCLGRPANKSWTQAERCGKHAALSERVNAVCVLSRSQGSSLKAMPSLSLQQHVGTHHIPIWHVSVFSLRLPGKVLDFT